MPTSDEWIAARAEAIAKISLPDLIAYLGDPPNSQTARGAKWVKCPLCGHGKSCFGVFTAEDGTQLYKCHHSSCNSAGGHIQYIEARLGMNRDDAQDMLFQIAQIEHPNERSKRQQAAKKPTSPPTPPPPTQPIAPLCRPTDHVRNPYEEVWKRLTLTDEHREQIKSTRGLDDAHIDAAGLRSSVRENEEKLTEILSMFDSKDLLQTGVAELDQQGNVIISRQLCGMRNTGRKRADGSVIWDRGGAVIFPYADQKGEIIFLRPHKGGLSGKAYERLYGEKPVMQHMYCFALIPIDLRPERLVLCEGEWKALALWQCGIPAVALPGITAARERRGASNPVAQELRDLLHDQEISRLVVAFDNEDKSNPKLPNYKPDPWKRHDAEVYAHLTADQFYRHLSRRTPPSSLVVTIPDSWRDARGKADWDGALIRFVQKHGYSTGVETAREAFEKALSHGKRSPLQGELDLDESTTANPDDPQHIIATRIWQLSYEPNLKVGGYEERETVNRLYKIPLEPRKELRLQALLEAYLQCDGALYYMKPLTMDSMFKTGALIKSQLEDRATLSDQEKAQREALLLLEDEDSPHPNAIAKAKTELADTQHALRQKNEILWALRKRLDGIPDLACNFSVECDYKLQRSDGTIERLVRLIDCMSKSSSDLVPLSSTDLASPQNMRTRVGAIPPGEFNWFAGSQILDRFSEDLNRMSYRRIIYELDYIGFHEPTGMFIGSDCAFHPDTGLILPDERGIIWHAGKGYRVNEDGLAQEGIYFFPEGTEKLLSDAEEKTHCTAIFETLLEDLFSSFGSLRGFVPVGMLFAYFCADLLLTKYGGHPSIWLVGRKSSGKTTMGKILLRIFGFKHLARETGMGNTTVAMDRILNQYSNVPVMLDEFRDKNAHQTMLETLRRAYMRQAKGKGRFDGSNRVNLTFARTTPLVCGESATSDPATLSRYLPCLMSPSARLGDITAQRKRFERMIQVEQHTYYRLGRYVLTHWAEFRQDFEKHLGDSLDRLSTVSDDRMRTSFSIVDAALRTLAGPSFFACAPIAAIHNKVWHEMLLGAAEEDMASLHELEFYMQWFEGVISAYQRGQITPGYILKEKVVFTRLETKPDGTLCGQFRQPSAFEADMPLVEPNDFACPQQRIVVLIAGQATHDQYAADLRKMGLDPDLTYMGLTKQLAKEPFSIGTVGGNPHRWYFVDRVGQNASRTSRHRCLCLDYQRLPSDLMEQFDNLFASEDDPDSDGDDS